MKSIAHKFIKSLQQGFTLLELIIVIALLAILSGFAISRSTISLNPKAQAEKIASLIRFTQSLAMTHGTHYYFEISQGTANYYIKTSTNTAINLPDTASTTGSLSSRSTFTNRVNMPSQVISFDGLGMPYTDTGATTTQKLTSTASFQITFTGGKTYTISISPLTGYVQVQ